MTNELLKPEADALQAPTAVGSGDLLGHINVPTLNKSWRTKMLIKLDAAARSVRTAKREPRTKLKSEISRISRLRTNYRSATKPAQSKSRNSMWPNEKS
jgi:hypothetical protein